MKESTRRVTYWLRVKKCSAGCWLWQGETNNSGYGLIRYKGRKIPVTHFAYYLATGQWPTDQINHVCHNPICVNPQHIYDGTQSQNMQDKINAGRHRQKDQYGEKNPKARLTVTKVKLIRKLHITGKYTLSSLAQRFDVSTVTIWNIVKNKCWVV